MTDVGNLEHQRTRTPREQVFLGATISYFGNTPSSKHRIRDLSRTGARIDCAAGLRMGATVLISVGCLEEVGATVIWVKDGLAGLKFAEPIELDAARSKAVVRRPAGDAQQPYKNLASRARPIGAGWIVGLNDPYSG